MLGLISSLGKRKKQKQKYDNNSRKCLTYFSLCTKLHVKRGAAKSSPYFVLPKSHIEPPLAIVIVGMRGSSVL